MNFGMFMLMPMLLLGGGMGGANELLDYVQSEVYWKTKNITPTVQTLSALLVADPKAEDISALIKQMGDEDFEKREAATAAIAKKGVGIVPQLKVATKSADAEIADRATRLIAELSGGETDPAIHRLMIIRGLGEMKDKAALPVLMGLIESKEPFVADHARRAIAAIEGKPYQGPSTSAEQFEKDVWMLPKGVKLATQLTIGSGGPVNWAKAMANVNLGPLGANISKDQMLDEMQKGVGIALNHTGNIRIDGITLGLSGNPGNNTGFVVIFVRGQYSREKVKSTLLAQGHKMGDDDGIPSVSPPNSNMKMLMPSDDLFVLVGGPPNPQGWPVAETVAAIKKGVGTIGEDKEMSAIIQSANRKSGGWAAVQMTEQYKAAEWLAPFDSIIAERISVKNKTTLNIKGTGGNAEAVAGAVKQMNDGIEVIKAQMQQGAAGGMIPKPMVDFASSLKAQADGKNATLTGTMEGGFEEMLGGLLFPMMMMGGPGF